MKYLKFISVSLILLFGSVIFAADQLLTLEYEEAAIETAQDGDIVCYRGAFRKMVGLKTTPLIHAGILVGEEVIEWVAYEDGPKVERVSKESFLARAPEGDLAFVLKIKGQKKTEVVVQAALSFFENPDAFGTSYHPLERNCQHFALLCATGHARSWQVEEYMVKFKKALYNPKLQAFITDESKSIEDMRFVKRKDHT